MTVLLVLFLIAVFVITDQLVQAASRRAAARRKDLLKGPSPLSLPTVPATLRGIDAHGLPPHSSAGLGVCSVSAAPIPRLDR